MLFRDPNLDFAEQAVPDGMFKPALPSPISLLLQPVIDEHLRFFDSPAPLDAARTFKKYAEELQYICTVNTLTNTPGVTLLEAEVVVGTILAKCTQRRFRKTRIDQMNLHVDMLVRTVQKDVQTIEDLKKVDRDKLLLALSRAWELWDFTTKKTDVFGGNSLGLLALRIICDVLGKLKDFSGA